MIEILALVLSCLAALIPTLLYVWLASWFDRYEREPRWLIITTFLWGAIPAIVVSLIFELLLDIPLAEVLAPETADLASAAFVAPIVEEFAKAIPLVLLFMLYRREFDGVVDGLLYGTLIGFGFAMTENVFYFLGAVSEGGWGSWGVLVFLRAIIFGLNHALFTGVTGAALGYARLTSSGVLRLLVPVIGLATAVGLHMIHNFFVSLEDSLTCFISLAVDWLGVVVVVLAGLWAASRESHWIREELHEEVQGGLLTPADVDAASSYRARMRERVAARTSHDQAGQMRVAARHETAAELGLKKRLHRLHPNEGHTPIIVALRQRLTELAG